jgi:hypothetical protein
MEEERKVYRTAGYRVDCNGKEHVFFWSIDPSFFEPGKAYIRHHDLHKGSTSTPITEHIPIIDAVKKIAEIEAGARKIYPLADESYKSHPYIGDRYRDAPHWTEHPALLAHSRQEKLKLLKARKPPGFGLK